MSYNSPLIWKGQNAQMLPSGVILKKDGTTILAGGSSFGIIQTPSGTSPTAGNGADTVIFASDGSTAISGNSSTKTVTFSQPASQTISSTAIDWSLGNLFKKSISGNTTFTFSNVVDGRTIVVRITSTGSFSVTWPTVKWAAGTPPTQTASGTDVYTFVYFGDSIVGSVVQAVA